MAVNKTLYLKAAAVTLVLFFAILLAGLYLDGQRTSIVRSQLELAGSQADESRVGLLFLQTFKDSPGFCDAFNLQIEAVASGLNKLGYQLKRFGEASKLEDLEGYKRKYAVANAELWLYSVNFKKQCGSDAITILYFYPDKSTCPACEAQARVLDGLKQKCGQKLLVYSLPADLDVGIVNTLKRQFNAERTPSLVVNERELIEGLANSGAIIAKAPSLAQCAG